MSYFISFLEGIITFISPCLLPMLPIYISYFAGQDNGKRKNIALFNALGFILGFTLVFMILGAFAGTIGKILKQDQVMVRTVAGTIVVIFGLNFMGILKIPFLNQNHVWRRSRVGDGFLSSILFGVIFSVSWTPCIGTFLGSALMLAASGAESMQGMLMLFCFSMGLGIPFLVSALLISQLKSTFDFIKKHYELIEKISGGFLVVIGVLMATGLFGYFLSLLS